jgi:hypothetical protein
VSGEEVEAWMIANGVVRANATAPEVPINQPCANEAAPASAPMTFRR